MRALNLAVIITLFSSSGQPLHPVPVIYAPINIIPPPDRMRWRFDYQMPHPWGMVSSSTTHGHHTCADVSIFLLKIIPTINPRAYVQVRVLLILLLLFVGKVKLINMHLLAGIFLQTWRGETFPGGWKSQYHPPLY